MAIQTGLDPVDERHGTVKLQLLVAADHDARQVIKAEEMVDMGTRDEHFAGRRIERGGGARISPRPNSNACRSTRN